MRKPVKSVFAAALGAVLLGAVPQGCTTDDATELVVGISTQVEVPRQLATVRLDVSAGGSLIFCQSYPVYNGRVQLPRTLGLTKDQVNVPITVSIFGFLQPVESLTIDCGQAPKIVDPTSANYNPASSARVLRRSTQPYIDGRILFIPMPLKYACFDIDCKEDETCRAGECKPAEIDPATLATYRDDYMFGNTSTCFHLKDCMYGAGLDGSGIGGPPELIDAATCRYRISGAGTGMNVMIAFDEFVTEILDEDPLEGFFFPNPTDKSVIQLAPGLCNNPPPPAKKPHPILSIAASRVCPPKSPLQPVCDSGDVALTPAKSGAYVFIDPQVLKSPDGLTKGWDDLKKSLELALGMPIFSNSNVSITLLPSAPSCSPALSAFQGVTKLDVNKLLGGLSSATTPPPASIRQALSQVKAGNVPGTSIKAVVVVTRGDVEDAQGCAIDGNKSAQALATDLAAQGVRTYVVLSEKNPADYPASALDHAKAVAIAGKTFDAADNKDINVGDFYGAKAVNDMASCVYLRPAHITDTSKAVLTHVVLPPFAPALGSVIPPNGCSSGNRSGDGWGIDGEQIYVCGKYCESIKNTNVLNAAIYGDKTNINKYVTPLSVVWASQPNPAP